MTCEDAEWVKMQGKASQCPYWFARAANARANDIGGQWSDAHI
jgi:hypothetical protein